MSAGPIASARVCCRGCHFWFHPALDARLTVSPLRCPNCGTEMSERTIRALVELARPTNAPQEADPHT